MHLSEKGNDIFIVDNFIKKKIESEFGIEPLFPTKTLQERVKVWNNQSKNKIDFEIGDLLNYRFLNGVLVMFKPDCIIHYAEQPSAPYSMGSRERAVFTQHNNVIGNLNLLFSIKKNCPDVHLIKLGTLGEYVWANMYGHNLFIKARLLPRTHANIIGTNVIGNAISCTDDIKCIWQEEGPERVRLWAAAVVLLQES